MGRKRKEGSINVDLNYFGVFQEQKVVEYLQSDDPIEKSKIYEEHLNLPIRKLVESIINTYKLYSTRDTYQDLFDDTISFLITKMDKFKPERGKKAYSYFGTIVKRKLQYNRIVENKEKTKCLLFEDTYEVFGEDPRFSYQIDEEEIKVDEEAERMKFFDIIIVNLKSDIDENELNDNDTKVGRAIIRIMRDRDLLFDVKTVKFNKNQIIETIKNLTMLNTKEVSESLKFFKKVYILNKDKRHGS
jgi:hypothetical protein